MENHLSFKLTFEHVSANDQRHTFRIAFSNCESRILLPYPNVTGIRFFDPTGNELTVWRTGRLVSEPLDDFVLTPNARISFDLIAYVNAPPDINPRWKATLPLGKLIAQYKYHVDDERGWYDFLAKRSRFAAITPPWNGTAKSNRIELENHITPTA